MSRNKIEATLKLETLLIAPSNIQHSDLAEMSYCDETYQNEMKGKKETWAGIFVMTFQWNEEGGKVTANKNCILFYFKDSISLGWAICTFSFI